MRTPKKRKVETPKRKKAITPTTNDDQPLHCSNEPSKKISSRGSALQLTPLVDDDVVQSLSKECTFLHKRVCALPTDEPIAMNLPKELFHYDEDGIARINKEDVKELLSGSMLNISVIQGFMRYRHVINMILTSLI